MAAPDRANNPKRRFVENWGGAGYKVSDDKGNEDIISWEQDTNAQRRIAAHGLNKGTAGKMDFNKITEDALKAVGGDRYGTKVNNAREMSRNRVQWAGREAKPYDSFGGTVQ